MTVQRSARSASIAAGLLILLALLPSTLFAQTPVTITVDTSANRHPISPLIYGVCWASTQQLQLLNSPLNRAGGNNETCYNWQLNASNHANDWFFESIGDDSPAPGERGDTFISQTKAAGAQPMLTVPMLGWVAKLGPNRAKLWSFSVAKYGKQQKTDPYTPDAGNGVLPDGKTNITGNDPDDANTRSSVDFERNWVSHLVGKWGKSARGGVEFYIMDNEPMLWNSTHRDVHPQPVSDDEYFSDFSRYADMVKQEDPNALVCAPESWGWNGYLYSAADSDYMSKHNWQGHPDRDAHGGLSFIPWLLSEVRQHDEKTHKRSLDYLTVHIYPQGGDGGDDTSPKIELLRNRSTRALWDPSYKDESWINDTVMLIPRLKKWVADYYPGTKIGITEYNWGAEKSMSGATAQADILGIFGREGLDLATRWTTPDASTPTFKAIQMYRNYDGNKSTFGDISVSDTVPSPDDLSSFAAIRSSDHALTIMVINKQLTSAPVSIVVKNFRAGYARVWQLSGAGTNATISQLPQLNDQANGVTATLPPQSVTLFVLPEMGSLKQVDLGK